MHADDLADYRRQHVPLYNANRMKLGVFGTNVSGGGTMTKAPTSFVPTFEHNLSIARKADALGLEFTIPFGRWKSFGGDTQAEAQAAFDRIIEDGDWGAAHNIMRILGIESNSFDAQIELFAKRFVAGWGGYLLVGTPEQVVDRFIDIEKAGVEGMALVWHDYDQELPYFGERVLPLMKQAGLRI